MKKILIFGATSAIVEATARIWAQEGHQLYLVARNKERLLAIANDLKIRGAQQVDIAVCDINDYAQHQQLITNAIEVLDTIDIVLIGHGSLSNQQLCEKNFNLTLVELNTNAISTMSLLTHLSNYFEAHRKGCIAVITSVAGDRGRQSNYIYGAAKGALALFMQGMRQRLYKSNVNVLTIKPGFVDTAMIAHLKKNLLWSKPEVVAKKIHQGILKGKSVIYAPGFWFLIMSLVRIIPETLFKKIKL